MVTDLLRVIDQVSREKGLEREVLIATLEEAVHTAAKKKFRLSCWGSVRHFIANAANIKRTANVVGAACVHGCTYVAEQVNFERMCQSWLFADNCRGMRVSDAAAICGEDR